MIETTKDDVNIYILLVFFCFQCSIDMDDEFVECVQQFVHFIISSEMLVTKQINGWESKGENLLLYIKVIISHTFS